ncbi:benzil reductase ((S)-benzoin forming) [Paenibacillus shirakamiensis]|uniref:Benzil reductase ((S)-benzoin forming) n=1 Tax=Paenibacillus shirakamiensis TaxID=1265935 RepID=A0ABS4JHZ6_9BACL|nr:SDR family NAD(P)-dependent oxidoreductase [Paenibacillus shirakamiensis]MBP2000591.1 benzil reductase ((S)-benzoin forming) [Paenibacillus shirakamiensis]
MKVFILTGTSRGLGFEMCSRLIQCGHRIISISRTAHDELEQLAAQHRVPFHFLKYDLQQVEGISDVMQGILEHMPVEHIKSITLINNSAQITPLGSIQLYSPEDIIRNIQVNFTAPVLLTQLLLKYTEHWNIHRNIVNISSASAHYAAPGMSMYCASKAAIHMFTCCIQLENHKDLSIYTIDPGMMDTTLQMSARNEKRLSIAPLFREAKEKGELRAPGEVAEEIVEKLLTMTI